LPTEKPPTNTYSPTDASPSARTYATALLSNWQQFARSSRVGLSLTAVSEIPCGSQAGLALYAQLCYNCGEGGEEMAQIDTRHIEKDLLMALLIAKHYPENIDLLIAKARAKMEKSDVEEVIEEFEEYRKIRK
jgi:hypothetical protein